MDLTTTSNPAEGKVIRGSQAWLDSFDTGIDDARDLVMMRAGMESPYYEGYVFACEVDGMV